VLVVGPNGAGKTNLLEAVHVAAQGFSFRTRRDAGAIRFGAAAARVSLEGRSRDGVPFTATATLERAGAKRLSVNGATIAAVDDLRSTFPVLAFTPDRLAVVKGGPAVRRTYLDRAIGRLAPARAAIPGEYANALSQRNAALRRVRSGMAARAALEPWDAAVVRLAGELDAARCDAVESLASWFREEAEALGLADASIEYSPVALTAQDLAARLPRDLERGTTGEGPHLADLELSAAGTDLRNYGSQGQQRLAVLALLLAESRTLSAARDEPPLLLLDDVLSELDDRRRAALLAGSASRCQTLVSATTDRAIPPGARQPDQIVDVVPGEARTR
jgi:DNA replication and repair protein RecF